MNQFFRRLRYLLNRRRIDKELRNDMDFHREMAAREGGGHFGNTLRLREEARDAWGWTWIERFSQDLRYAARMLRKSPGFTLAAVLMLALGIGVNVAVFGFFDFMFLRPLPVRDPQTILRFTRRTPQRFAGFLPYPEMAFFAENSRTLSAVFGLSPAKVSIDGEEKQINAHFVTANFFSELRAIPRLGRAFDSGTERAVVLSESFWQRHFGADPWIVGKTIRLNDKPATVIGVASTEFSGLSMNPPDVWAPIVQQPYFVDGSKLLTNFSGDTGVEVWGRLRPGLAPKAAEDELRSLAAQLRRQRPNDIWENESLPSQAGGYAKGLREGGRSGTGTEPRDETYPIFALVGVFGLLILAAACGNLGSLLLARSVARQREIGIRVAVGAGSGRLIRQLFTESVLLALLGSVAGMGLGYVVLRSLMAAIGAPAWLNATPDWRVGAFAVCAGFAAAVLFGLTPALQAARQRHRATGMRQLLIGVQVAASCVLLIVAGLLIRALNRAVSVQPGFEYRRVVSIAPDLKAHGYSTVEARAYLDKLESRLREAGGVESVALTDTAPLGNRVSAAGFEMNGHGVEILLHRIDPEFLETMQIPLLKGRNLTRGDTHSIVVSESFARRVWPGENPLGRKFTMGDSTGTPVDYDVVGVSGSARIVKLEDPDMVTVYFLAEPVDLPSMVVLVKTYGPPADFTHRAAAIAKTIDPKIIPEVQTLTSSFHQKLQSMEIIALAVGALGFLALLLACLGIVGLVAYAVSQRTREIGIRMALGAKPSHVLASVLRQFSRPVIFGLLAGAGAAAALSQLLRRELYGVSNLDPASYAGAIGIFAACAALAALVPARQALRVDPLRALRHE